MHIQFGFPEWAVPNFIGFDGFVLEGVRDGHGNEGSATNVMLKLALHFGNARQVPELQPYIYRTTPEVYYSEARVALL